ncbi:unnamed protein product [Ambrosiozyma monospora]|uniref:Unnamed protein product n=1 Tax=Ambrosiozyma monospora TaxID=43982 RepID=A0A9W6YZ11_AMBMO|nr:unnamed protein product [Ambrosiozyma monospora]
MRPLRILYLRNLSNILFFLLCVKSVTSIPIPVPIATKLQQDPETQSSWVGQQTTVRLGEVIPDTQQSPSSSPSPYPSSSSYSSNVIDADSTSISTETMTTQPSESPSRFTAWMPTITTTTQIVEDGILQKRTIYSIDATSPTTLASAIINDSTSTRSSILLNTVPANTLEVSFASMKPAFENEPAATSTSSDDNSSSSSADQTTKKYGVSKVLIIILAVWGGLVLAIIIIYSYFYRKRRFMERQAAEILEKTHKHKKTQSSISMTIGLASTPIDLHRNPTIKTTGGFVKSGLPSMRRPNNTKGRSPEIGTARASVNDLLSSPISGMISSPTGTIIPPVQLNYSRPSKAPGMTRNTGGTQGTGLTGKTCVTQLDPDMYERQALRKSQLQNIQNSKPPPKISRPEDVVVRRSFPRWI